MYENGWKVEPYRASRSNGTGKSDHFGAICSASWAQVDATLVGEFVQRIVDSGGWCSFAIPPDGGVLLATVLHAGRKYTIAARSTEAAEEGLRWLKDDAARNW